MKNNQHSMEDYKGECTGEIFILSYAQNEGKIVTDISVLINKHYYKNEG